MRKKKEGPQAHDLRDAPVPSVSGRAQDQQDVRIHPEESGVSLDDTIVFKGLQ